MQKIPPEPREVFDSLVADHVRARRCPASPEEKRLGEFHRGQTALRCEATTSLQTHDGVAPDASSNDIPIPKPWSCKLCEPGLQVVLDTALARLFSTWDPRRCASSERSTCPAVH